MDVLAEALSAMRTSSPTSVRTNGRAPWGLRLPPVLGAGFHVVLEGSCWLLPCDAAHSEPVALHSGDIVFLRAGNGHALADHPATPVEVPGADAYHFDPPIGTVSLGDQGELTRLLCGNYHLDVTRPHPLVRQLPQVVHLRSDADRSPELTNVVALLNGELERPRIGSEGIIAALIDSMLLYILRAWYDRQPADAARGWATALADPAVAPALSAIHRSPATQWTVDSLAKEVGLSRAAFARRFTGLVGEPPMAYVTRWRMTTAARLLREVDAPLQTVAVRSGYGSAFALAKAFKREFGESPGSYRAAMSA